MTERKAVTLQPSVTGARFGVLAHDDYAEVMGIIAAYGRFYDDDRIDDFIDLLAEDAVFYPNWPGVAPEEVSGKAALRDFFGGARAQCVTAGIQPRHFATNVILAAATADTAEVTVAMLYAEATPGAGEPRLKMVGQYDYALARRDGRWAIGRWSMHYDK